MKATSIANHYKTHDAACSSPQLVILLLDAGVRYCREAALHLRNHRWEDKGKAVEAIHACLMELRNGLNHNDGSEIVQNLDRMYDFLMTKVTYGNLSKDPLQFEQVAESLQGIREAWQTLFDKLKTSGALAEM